TPAFDALKGRVDALYVCNDPLFIATAIRINTLAHGAQLPTMYGIRQLVEAGGLMSYGPNYPDLFRRPPEYLAQLLRRASPGGPRQGDLPAEQATRFDLIVNLPTAKALGLTIPEPFLLRANEMIE